MITDYRSILIWGTKEEFGEETTEGCGLLVGCQAHSKPPFLHRLVHLPRDGTVHSGYQLAIKKMPLRQATGQCGRGNYSTEVPLSPAVKLTMKNSHHASLATQQIRRELVAQV